MKQYVFLLLLGLCLNQCCSGGCPNNGYCLCNSTGPVDSCAMQLTSDSQSFNISNNVTYFYYQPEYEVYELIQLSFCGGNNLSGVVNTLLVTIESAPGDYPYTSNSDNATFPATTLCNIFYLSGAVFKDMDNQQRQKLLLAIYSNNTTNQTMSGYIVGQEAKSILIPILFSAVGVLTLILIVGGGILIYKRCQQKKTVQLENDLSHLDKMMPIQRLQELRTGEVTNCAVCLVDVNPTENIRKTPCGHYFHEACINDWCKKSLNCPVCREDFSLQGFQQREKRSIKPQEEWTSNIQNNLIDNSSL